MVSPSEPMDYISGRSPDSDQSLVSGAIATETVSALSGASDIANFYLYKNLPIIHVKDGGTFCIECDPGEGGEGGG